MQPDYKPREERYSSPFSKPNYGAVDAAVQNKNLFNYSNADPGFKAFLETNAENSNNNPNYDCSDRLLSKSGRSYTPQNITEEKDLSYNLNARRNSEPFRRNI